ncbi:MAG: hypothetical protein AB8I08_08865 [Sandaracinaceae bacterium]
MRSLPILLTASCLLLTACDGETPPADAGSDASVTPDAGTDSGPAPPLDAGVDAGPPALRDLTLSWVTRVTSAQTLGGVAEARLAPLPDEGFVLSLTTGGAPTVFGEGGAAVTVGDATTLVSQAGAWYDSDGALVAARGVSTAAADGFAGLGYGVSTRADAGALFAGRFEGSGVFGGSDPGAVPLMTTVEMPDDMTVWTAAEGYLASFGADRRFESVVPVASTRGLADHRLVDVAALPSGGSLVLGLATGRAVLGSETLSPTPGADGEVFLARLDDTGATTWVRRVQGTSQPTRLAVFADGSSAALIRYSGMLRVAPGETGERVLPAPPAGTLRWDAVLRFDADGDLLWARPMGSDATTYPGLRDLRTHADGSLTVAGTFRGETSWPDASEIPPALIFGVDGLITRIDAEGTLAWQTRIRSLRTLLVQAVEPADDAETWLLLTVAAEGATFEFTEGPPLVLPESSANARLVILRYGASGELLGGQHLGTNDVDGDDLLRLTSGDLVVVGRYGEGTQLEPGAADSQTLPDAEAERNVFLARYTRAR